VAIYSNADENALHASMADEAYLIGSGPEASNSYLLMEEVLDITKKSNAQAIHPGYGFLSENASFASACASTNGVTFIGPPPAAISAMGSKSESKRIMMNANVPCTPGYNGSDGDGPQDPEYLLQQAIEIVGFPCLIKATMGGGGKGMRLVHTPETFLSALDSCKRECLSAFGNDTVILERYLTNPRHVEVQICGDMHGNVVHLHERDCSVQRRHQKVFEEAPAPGLSEGVRKELGEVAVRAAKAVGYVGAGTVEFLMEEQQQHDQSDSRTGDDNAIGNFYFCEMNTRLQVEHPVTEMITGVDLVEWQLRVAAGETLPILDQDLIPTSGHAMEARIYAENPARDFLPATGTLQHLRPPMGEGVRVDTGVRAGDNVSVFYDPMISKLIVHGPDRTAALEKLVQSLKCYQVVGMPTNIPFLVKCANHDAFRRGSVNTGFLEKYSADVQIKEEDESNAPSPAGKALSVLSLLLTIEGRVGVLDINAERKQQGPWSNLSGSWRKGGDMERVVEFSCPTTDDATNKGTSNIKSTSHRDGSFTLTIDDEIYHVDGTLDSNGKLEATVNERHFSVTSILSQNYSQDGSIGDTIVNIWAKPGKHLGDVDEYTCSMSFPFAFANRNKASGEATLGSGSIKALMPGKVIRLNAAVGDEVEAGDVILVLEAMKMEHAIISPVHGVLSMVSCDVDDIVDDGRVLAVVGGNEDSNGGGIAGNEESIA